jgi:alkylation response protein AidB-like acyl-CoA dehydrogenase
MAWDVLTEEQREIRELVRTLARERVAPRAAEIDESHEFPWDVVELDLARTDPAQEARLAVPREPLDLRAAAPAEEDVGERGLRVG